MPERSSDFRRVDPAVDLHTLDAEILELWDRIDAFRLSVERRPLEAEYTFYDGPPFATGSPHYGHILAGVIKDIVPRYWTMRGRRIERRFGWDTHGLPVEMEVEKQLGISGPRQIAEFGVARFNEACRAMVERTTEEWEEITRRMGRWVDFENDYKTMDLDFMESVWWVFRRLWDEGLIYRAFKVLPYSWGAATPLSNFELNLGGYREVEDPAVTVRLEVLEGNDAVRRGDHLLIWTTTPWTLPGNLAVAVGEDIDYVCVDRDGDRYWVAAERVDALWDDQPPVVDRAQGADLVGVSYDPPFPYFEEERDHGAFRVIASEFVTTDEGTGLVHMAPAYGEEDFYALQAAGLDVLVDPVDAEGRFTEAVPDVAGLNVKDADPILIDLLRKSGKLYRSERIRHPYPFCYRTDTPLIYKAIPTWFVNVERFRDRMVELNRNIHWVPEYVGSRRFGNWLEEARDWAISRNRYWGSCIPVWECDSCGDQVCVGGIDELEQLSGVRPTDLHKHVVDEITWACGCGRGTMRRVPEVLDCWFESGSMPYAQIHYPFENRDRFERGFPADFIAEGLDQTRGWFYTLMVLATALFDTEPFRNAVVNGLILAEDGRKMSKSLKNYPDPSHVLDEYGADALRAYLITSPAVRAEPLRFSEEGVREVVRTVVLPLWNAFSFFTTYAEADGITLEDLRSAPPPSERPEIDRWILSMLQSLIAEVNEQMEGYYLYAVIPPTLGFIDHLTNWYVRRSRRRFWRTRTEDDRDKFAAFATLYEVLTTFSKVLAPILPFVTERIYQDLVVRPGAADGVESVHHADFPEADHELIDTELEAAVATVREVVRLGQRLRKQEGVRVRQPLPALTVLTTDPDVVAAVTSHTGLILDELNVKRLDVRSDESALVELEAKADFKRLGPRLGEKVKAVAAALSALPGEEVQALAEGRPVTVAGIEVGPEDVVIRRNPRPGTAVASGDRLSVALDTSVDHELAVEGAARELVARINQLRREAALAVTDRIVLVWSSDDEVIREAFTRHRETIAQEVLADEMREDAAAGELMDVAGRTVRLSVARA